MSNNVLISVIIGSAVVVSAILVYQASQKTSQSIADATKGSSNINNLAGQVSDVLSSLGVKSGE